MFENTPGKQSSRSGDPSTTDRQFTRGYIGLQNHGDVDVIDYRNVRVQPLDAGSVQGPVTVSGNGAHTVEYRSTDVAGNVEATKSVDFTIGAADGEKTAAGDHAARSTRPRRARVAPTPVRSTCTLSATDPAETGGGGGPAATRRRQRAAGPRGTRTRSTAKVGDTVRWNFPAATAGAPHDLWWIKPGEAPLSDGTLLVTGDLPIVLPGGPSISRVVDQAGTYTFICKIHGHKGATEWEGMVGKITVTSGGSHGAGLGCGLHRVPRQRRCVDQEGQHGQRRRRS